MMAEGAAGDAGTTGTEGEAAGLTHLDAKGRARMVDVAAKDVTARTAIASCEVHVEPRVAALVAEGGLPKGDVLALARIAGIQASKRTAELIPLCHQVALTSVDVELAVDVERGIVEVSARACATDRTGVEMEAMTAAAVAALTVYDMVKAVQRDATVSGLRLRHKSGGRSGDITLP